MQPQNSFDLRQILGVIRRWAWLIIACMLVGGGVAYAVSARMPPQYKASTTILVLLPDDSRSSEYNTLVAGERLALTYSQMVKQRPTLAAVIEQLELNTTPEQLAQHILVEPIRDTQLIRVTASYSSPEKAAEVANTVSQAFTSLVKTLQEGRFREDLQSIEGKVNALKDLIDATQARADALSRQQIADGVERARLERQLPEYNSRYRALQDTYSAALLAAAKSATRLQAATPAQVSGPSSTGAYTATVFLMLANDSLTAGNAKTNILADNELVAAYVKMLTAQPVLAGAITELKLPERPGELAGRIKAEWVPDRQLIRLSAGDKNAAAAARLAETVARSFGAQLETALPVVPDQRLAEIQTELDQLDATVTKGQARVDELTAAQLSEQRQLSQLDTALAEYRNQYRTAQQDYEQQKQNASRMAAPLSISEPASVPRAPTGNTRLYILLAALVGGALALMLAFLFEYLDEAVQTPEDVSGRLNLATLATVTRLGRAERQSVTTSSTDPSFEAFRVLATKLLMSKAKSPLQSLLVTSPSAGEGKSLVAANLAAALSLTGLRVALVDADLRNPGLHKLFALSAENGLTEAARRGKINGNLQGTPIAGLSVLLAGALPRDPAGLISSPGLKQVLHELASQADMVIIDSPPVLSVADTALLAAQANGVLLVLRAGRTRSQAARQAVDTLNLTETRVVGAVLNGVPAGEAGYDYRPASRKPHRLTPAFWRK